MAHDVFISYSSKDKATADAVCNRLETNGIRCWIAPRDIPFGADFPEEIVKAISASRVMVLVFSSNTNNTAQVVREVGCAADHDVIIVPFRIEDVTPSIKLEFFLGVIHWLDAITPPLEQHIDTLVRTIRTILDTNVARADLPVSAEEAQDGAIKTVTGPQGPVEVRVPAGAVNGQVIRLDGRGVQGEKGERPGDLVVTLHVAHPPAPAPMPAQTPVPEPSIVKEEAPAVFQAPVVEQAAQAREAPTSEQAPPGPARDAGMVFSRGSTPAQTGQPQQTISTQPQQAPPNPQPQTTPANRDIRIEIGLTAKEAMQGGSKGVTVAGRTVHILIPPGLRDGEQRSYSGLGVPGDAFAPAGALIVTFRMAPVPAMAATGGSAPPPLSVPQSGPTLTPPRPPASAPQWNAPPRTPEVTLNPANSAAQIPNTSGMGKEFIIPREIMGFNWGAFLISLPWSIFNKAWIGLGIVGVSIVLFCILADLVPNTDIMLILPYLLSLVIGFKGNEWAWQNRKWQSIDQFRRVQKIWSWWGIGFGIMVLLFFTFYLIGKSLEKTTSLNTPVVAPASERVVAALGKSAPRS